MQSFGGAQLYDAIYLAPNELMQTQRGRKVVVVLSGGVDRGSKESLPSAIEAAQRANTTVYAIFVKNERENRSGEEGGRTRGAGEFPEWVVRPAALAWAATVDAGSRREIFPMAR